MNTAKRTIAALLAVTMLVTACGDTRIERAGSGAVTGAAAGGIAGALCCNAPVDNTAKGLFIGMAVGAIIGFLLPEPIFFNRNRD